MKRKYLILLFCLLSFEVYSFDKKALADTLSNYVNQKAKIGKVTLPRVLQRGNRIEIYASKNLEWVSLTEQDVKHLRNLCNQYVSGEENNTVLIYTNGKELGDLYTHVNLKQTDDNTPHGQKYVLIESREPLTRNISAPYSTQQGLAGIHLAVYGSHGLYYNQQDERWTFQRAKLLTTVEDLYTSAYTMPFLVPMLENAGAIVLQPRERDTQTKEIIVDDSYLRLPEGWKSESSGGWATPQRPLMEGENPFRKGGYAYTITDKHSELRYTPQVDTEGDYALYVSYKTLRNSTTAAEYTVMHAGIRTVFYVNQQMGGSTWIYLGTFRFTDNPNDNYIEISNRGKAGSALTSDAVRLGGGMGSIGRYKEPSDGSKTAEPEISGYPRYIEGARYWMQYAGIPDSVYNYSESKNDYTDDFASRGRWLNYLAGGSPANPQNKGLNIPLHAALAFHTDAGLTTNDDIIGTLTIYTDRNNDKQPTYPTGISRLSARQYADYIQTQIVEDIRATYAPEWQRRELKNASYSETRNPEIPTIILELLSHQNLADMRYGLDPRFRFLVCRAVYKGILKYLHQQHGTDYIVQPLPIERFQIRLTDENKVSLRWKGVHDPLEKTAKPTYYIVYKREAGGDWDNGTKVVQNELTLTLNKDTRYDFRVAAGNKGGISIPSEVLSAHIASNPKGKILIINGFTRLGAPESFCIDSTLAGFNPMSQAVPYGKEVCYLGAQYEFRRSEQWISDDACGFGASYMDYSNIYTMGNTFDYPVMHGQVLANLGYTYLSSSVMAIDSIPSEFSVVDIIMGKQKESSLGTQKNTVDFKTFPKKLQTAVRSYQQHGGSILLSGAYISSDLKKSTDDKDFLNNCLHSKYITCNATRSGNITTRNILPTGRYLLHTTPNPEIIHAESVEAISPADQFTKCAARYADSGTTAAVAFDDGQKRLLFFAFPLESIDNFNELYTNSINWLTK